MAWTSGFFNSVNGDRTYTADQMSKIFEGLITDGVYNSVRNKLAVQPNSGMTIQINTGRGWFGGHWVNNDSIYLQTLEGSDVLLNRYCAVCIRVAENEDERSAIPYFKYSEFATNPTKPTMTRTETIKEYCLAYVYIPAGATSISASNIEDTRSNTEVCGWVTGLIEQIDTATLWSQFQSQFNDFMTNEETDFLNWFNSLEVYLDENVATKLSNDVLQLQSDVSNLENQIIKTTGTFNSLGWSNQGDGTYTQTITVSGVTSTNDIIVSPTAEYEETYKTMCCEAVSQNTNSITFVCRNPQDVNIVMNVIIFNL